MDYVVTFLLDLAAFALSAGFVTLCVWGWVEMVYSFEPVVPPPAAPPAPPARTRETSREG